MKPTVCSSLFAAVCLAAAPLHAEIQHVIAISVDGLRGDFLQSFLDSAPAEFPGLVRLRNGGASTFNARCDYDYSETVPNHLAMMTGRPVLQSGGLPANGFTGFTNNFPTTTDTVHVYATASGVNSGPYKATIFDVVHDRGLSTALYLGKTRLEIMRRSVSATNGALDSVGADNGRNKIDFAQVQDGSTAGLVSTLVAHIGSTLERFTFFHITDPDTAGHSAGWNTTVGGAYRTSIKTLDGYLVSIFNKLDSTPALNGKVAIALTGDHGGGGLASAPTAHTDATQPGNYTVPFFLTAPGVPPGSDLYALFENRTNPGGNRPSFSASAQPVHNADIANLSATLLGLPTVSGSLLVPEFKKPLAIVREEDAVTVRWPLYLTAYSLEVTTSLDAPDWMRITTGIVEDAETRSYRLPLSATTQGFFRVRLTAN